MYPKKVAKKGPGSEAGAQISDSRKEKLLSIQTREKLKGVLNNKFTAKYATGTTDDRKAAGLITKEVDKFMRSAQVTEEELAKLEHRIRDALSNLGQRETKKENTRPSSSHSQAPEKRVLIAETDNASQSFHSPRSVSIRNQDFDAASVAPSVAVLHDLGEKDEWAAISKFNREKHLEEERLAQEKAINEKRRIKSELDRQLQLQKSLKQQQKLDEINLAKRTMDEVERWKMSEKQRADEIKLRSLKEKEIRDLQLEDEKRKKEEDARRKKMEEENQVRRLQEHAEAEKARERRRKLEEREMLKHVLEDNERQRARRLEKKQEEMKADVESAKEYVRILDKQDADRQAALKAREDRQKTLMNRMKDTVVKQKEDKSMEDERRAQAHQAARDAKLRADEEAQRQKKLKQREDTKSLLNSQMMEKQRKKDLEEQERKRLANSFKREAEDYVQSERDKKLARKQLNVTNRVLLEQQIDERKRGAQLKMTEIEARLNSDLLKQVIEHIHHKDPQSPASPSYAISQIQLE